MILKPLFLLTLFTCTTLALTNCSYAATYIGNEACSTCHKTTAISWEMGAHARAFETLKPGTKQQEKLKAKLDPDKDYTDDIKCLKCHTTGYDEEGGFKDITSTPAMAGVGCESCHGAGSKYKWVHARNKNFTRKEAKDAGEVFASEDASVCNACHISKDKPFTEKMDNKYKFNYRKSIDNRKSYHDKRASNK